MSEVAVKQEPLRLDLGSGKRPREGFIGVDIRELPQVGYVVDLRGPWPWLTDSVDEIHCSHFLEHLTQDQRINFWNEAYRVLKPDAQITVIAPHWSNARAYGDPTHVWPPVSEFVQLYLQEQWRRENADHVPLECNFDTNIGGDTEEWVLLRKQDAAAFATAHYLNAYRDIAIVGFKRPRLPPIEE